MHDVKTFPASPGLARRLIQFSILNHMAFDSKLVELAMEGLVTSAELEGFAHKLDSAQLSSLQFARDWEGRALLLCSKPDRARSVALANAWLNGGKTLILSQPRFYAQWATMIREIWPEASISVFGNPRYQEKDQALPAGVKFTDKPDTSADFLVSSYGGVIWNNIIGTLDISQTIVEELNHPGAVNYKWESALKGIFHEIPKPLFIQNINSLPSDAGRDNLSSLQATNSKAVLFLGNLITNYMWAGTSHMGALTNGIRLNEIEDYLVGRGYTGVDHLRLLSLFGVSSHLLDDAEGHKSPIVFYDNTLKDLLGDKQRRSSSGLFNLYKQERAVEDQTGVKLSDTVQSALEGDRPSMTLIGALKTPQWANLKAKHLTSIHRNLATRMSRCLMLTDNQYIKQPLLLQFGLQMEDLSRSRDRNFTVARFLYPNCEGMTIKPEQWSMMRPLSNLLVTLDDLIEFPNLLQNANFLFLCEQTIDPEYAQAIKLAAQASGTRLVNSVIRETFEELIYKQLR